MSTSHIVSLLIEERSRLEAAIAALQGSPEPMKEDPPAWVLPKVKAPAAAPKRKRISAEGRRRMAEGQKRRYAAIRAAESDAPKSKTAKAILAEVIAPKEDAEFKSKMSIAMAKSWAKRRAAAKKKPPK